MASTNGLQGAPSNLTLTIDGLSTIFSNGNVITGNYLNSNANTTNVNTQIQLQPGGQFDIDNSAGLSLFNINEINSITTIARAQMSGAPVAGSDLCNKSYVDTQVGNPIQKTGTTTELNGNAVLSTVPGSSFSFSDGSGNNLVVYGQNNTSCYTAGGIWTVYTSNIPTLALIQCQESTGITSFYNPQSSWAPSNFLDLTNKGYVDATITTVTSGYWQKTGSIGLSGLYQLSPSSTMFFQNSSGTNLLTLSGSGVSVNNPVITGTTNLFTLYNTYGGSNQLLQIDNTGNLQNCPNLEYIYGSATSTLKQSVATGLSTQRQTLQWVRNPNAPQGWRLNCDFEQKFPQSDIPITIPNLYSLALTTRQSTTYNAITMNCDDTAVGTSMRMLFSHGTTGAINSIIQSIILAGTNRSQLNFYTQNSSLLLLWSMNYDGTYAILNTPQPYFYIGDQTGNFIATNSNGFAISSPNFTVNTSGVTITYPTGRDFLTLYNQAQTTGEYINFHFQNGSSSSTGTQSYVQSYLPNTTSTQLRFFTSFASLTRQAWYMSCTTQVSVLSTSNNYMSVSDGVGNYLSSGSTGITLASSSGTNYLTMNSNGTNTFFGNTYTNGASNFGIGIGNNLTKFWVNTTNWTGSPSSYFGTLTAWTSAWSIPCALGSNNTQAPAIGMSFDGNANPWIITLQPNIAWKPLSFLSSSHYFYTNANLNTSAVSIGTSAILQVTNTGAYRTNHLIITGQEFYDVNQSSTGMAINIGVNRSGNKQMWFMDPDLAVNGTNSCIRMSGGTSGVYIGGVSTNGLNLTTMSLGATSVSVGGLGTGAVYSNGSTLTNTNPSDATLKCHINPMTDNINKIVQLDPVSYHWKDEAVHGSKLNYGFLAQDIKEVIPEIVSEFQHEIKGEPLIDDTGLITYPNKTYETKLGYDPVSLIPFLVGAIKEQQTSINQLILHVTDLTNQLNALTLKINSN
jgi:hypothetical protein